MFAGLRRAALHGAAGLATLALAAAWSPAQAQDARNPRNCKDPWVDAALRQVKRETGRPETIIGWGDQQECNIRSYGGGSWSGYQDLVGKVRQALGAQRDGTCRDPWITQAVTEYHQTAHHRETTPRGAGEIGECSMYLYSSRGTWSSQAELKLRVFAVLNEYETGGFAFDRSGNLRQISDNQIGVPAELLYVAPGPKRVDPARALNGQPSF